MSPWKGHGRPAAVCSVRFKGGASPLSSFLAAAAAVGGAKPAIQPKPRHRRGHATGITHTTVPWTWPTCLPVLRSKADGAKPL